MCFNGWSGLGNMADNLWAICLAGICSWMVSSEISSLLKHWAIVEVVSRLYLLDERINKEVDAAFNSGFSISLPIKKLICLAIIFQKKVCHALLLHVLSSESAWKFFDISFWHERTSLITILCNGFASHYFTLGFLDGKYWIPSLVPILCLSANAAIYMKSAFMSLFLWPSLAFALLFLLSYSLIVHFLHAGYQFRSALLSDCASHAERLGSLHLAKQILESLFSPFSAYSLAGPCFTIVCLNFSVGVCHYPEQFLLKKIASSYSQTDCSICLDQLNKIPITDITLTDCFHFFHVECLHTWSQHQKKTTCPLCRKQIIEEGEEEKSYLNEEDEPVIDRFTLPQAPPILLQ